MPGLGNYQHPVGGLGLVQLPAPSMGGLYDFLTAELESAWRKKHGSAHYPTLRENAQGAVAGLGRFAGMSPEQAAGFSQPMTEAIENVSPLGMLTSAEDAENSNSYAGMVLASLGAIPSGGLGAVAKTGEKAIEKGIRAFHGSPHSFDRFDLSKIGTGEGAQAYGHGLYMTETPDIARGYRDSVGSAQQLDPEMKIGGVPVNDYYNNLEQRLARMPAKDAEQGYNRLALLEDLAYGGDAQYIREKAAQDAYSPETMEWFEKNVAPNFKRKGTLYEVNINADPAHFLDWDRPLSEQPQKIRDIYSKTTGHQDPTAIGERLKAINLEMDAMAVDRDPVTNMMREERRWNELAREREKLFPVWDAAQSGGKIYNAVVDQTDKAARGSMPYKKRAEAAAEQLRKAGIPGIKYLDQGSRVAGDGSRNYVVFDDRLVSIVKKYGIAAALGAGVISEEMARQMQAQGLDKNSRT